MGLFSVFIIRQPSEDRLKSITKQGWRIFHAKEKYLLKLCFAENSDGERISSSNTKVDSIGKGVFPNTLLVL